MQAILLATDEKGKLPALTKGRPAPMLPVANRPLMAYAIEMLVRQGIKHIVVSLYRLPGSIEGWFGSGARWGIELEYVLQREAWGTAGALKWAESCLHGSFLVLPADIVADVDLAALVACHRAQENAATLQLHRDGGDGISLVGDEIRAGAPGPWGLTGVGLFEPSVLALIPSRSSFDQTLDLLPALRSAGLRVGGLPTHGYYNGLNTYQDYHDAQQHFLLSAYADGRDRLNGTPPARFPTMEGKEIAPGIWRGRNYSIHPHARLAPPVCIGANCRIGRDVELGPGAVIGDNVVVDDGATIRESAILENTYVGQFVNLHGRVVDHNLIVDPLTEKATQVVDAFLLGAVQQNSADSSLRRVVGAVIAFILLLFWLLPLLVLAIALRLSTGRAFVKVNCEGRRDGRAPVSVLRLNTGRGSSQRPWLGRVVERLEWHRILELWAVCRGDLALVGVKPLLPEQVAPLTEEWQRTRYQQPPGVTGLWYVQSERGADLDEVLVADAYYAATRSWREDLRLLLQTPASWWRRLRSFE